MLIESLAQKTKLALMTVLATIGGCTLICGFTVWCCKIGRASCRERV